MIAEHWIGAYDTVGRKTLENVIQSMRDLEVIANCGMVYGEAIYVTVFPSIFQGIKHLGPIRSSD